MTDWWKETHGDAPETIRPIFKWAPVPGIRGCWRSPHGAPFDWQLERCESGSVQLDWLDDRRGFDDEASAIHWIKCTLSEWEEVLVS